MFIAIIVLYGVKVMLFYIFCKVNIYFLNVNWLF